MGGWLQLALTVLANADLKQRVERGVSRYVRAAALALAAGCVALLVLAFLAATLVAWLSQQVGPIWAPLIAAGVLAAIAAILMLAAYFTLHRNAPPKEAAAPTALPALAAALPEIAPLLRRRLPEIVAVAVVTGLLLGRHGRSR